MTTSISTQTVAEIPQKRVDAPKGKFQKFSEWVGEHKKEIAVAILIIGIAVITFGAGALLAIIPLSNFSVLHFGTFVAGLFTYSKEARGGLRLSGLSNTGILLIAGVASLIVGAAIAGFGSGKLSGLPSTKNQLPEKAKTLA